jgi:hypothetical protein
MASLTSSNTHTNMPALATRRACTTRVHARVRPPVSAGASRSAGELAPPRPDAPAFLAAAGQTLATATLAVSLLVGELCGRREGMEGRERGETKTICAPPQTHLPKLSLTSLLNLSPHPTPNQQTASPASARLEGVNKPELLPPGPPVPVLDVAGFLTAGEETRLAARVVALEADTGVRLRVLAQNYPQTPGLAIRDYWGVDGDTVVFVADPNTGNILNFNVGEGVDLRVPRSFWSRLANKFGTKRYWSEKGQEAAIVNAVNAIDVCLREPMGVGQCVRVADGVV